MRPPMRLLLLLFACGAPSSDNGCFTNACAGSSDCAMGTRCNQALTPPRCEKLYCGAEGSTCDNDLLCAQGTTCSAGICSSGSLPGEPCNDTACSGGLVCVRSAGSCDATCQPSAPPLAPTGAECSRDSECSSQKCNHVGGNCLGTCAGPAAPYPPGPYGFSKGSVIANLSFSGKREINGVYSSMMPIALSDYYRSAKYLALLGENKSMPCVDQQQLIATWTAQHPDVRFLEVLTQALNVQGPATESDIDDWIAIGALHIDVAVDPLNNLSQFTSGEFPLALIIDTSTMTIIGASVATEDLTAQLNALP
jgi:hypothetical protein